MAAWYNIRRALSSTFNIANRVRTYATAVHKKDWQKDVVYLYQFPRSPIIPNLSPFCFKVETWLRMKQLVYEVIPTWRTRSKEGLLPFVELNGTQVADSQLIIHRLQQHFNVDDRIDDQQRAIGHAIERMIEGSTF